MIDLTPIFQAVIALLAALITYKLIPWIQARTTERQQKNIAAAVRMAVYAAEQLYGAGQGEEKLQYAIEALQKAGFRLDKDMIRAAIENAVYDMNHFQNLDEQEEKEDPKEETPAE